MEMNEIRQNELIEDPIIMGSIRNILERIGEDSKRDGLERTPYRMTKAYAEWFGGYNKDPKKVLDRLFKTDYNGMVIVRDIKFYSHCEHHMAPFFGKAHVAYIPMGKIVGLDKIIKLVEIYARRLQTQEQLTFQIAKGIQDVLNPLGVGVQISAAHFCIMSRETRNQDSITTTTKLLGCMEKAGAKQEFFQAINQSVF